MDVSLRKPKNQSSLFSGGSSSGRPVKRRRTTSKKSFADTMGAVASSNAPEQKNYDLSVAVPAIAAAYQFSTVQLITGMAQGVGTGQRVGRRVVLTKMIIRWRQIGPQGRFCVIYDQQPNGVLPAITDIFDINDQNGLNNLNNSDRFMVLHDEYIIAQSIYDTTTGVTAGKWVYKREPLQQVWSGTTGTIADLSTGAIYVVWAGAAIVAGSFTYRSRVRFSDK